MRRGWLAGYAAIAALAGCIEVERPPTGTGGADNLPPIAEAGTGGSFLLGSRALLDGSASFDPDGGELAYRWSLDRAPPGAAAFEDSGRADAEILLDVPGTYVVTLRVEDAAGASDTSSVTLAAEPPGILADAGDDVVTEVFATVDLSGSAIAEDSRPVEVAWSFVERPAGSTAQLRGGATLTPSFDADRVGTYIVRLTASAGTAMATDDVMVSAAADQLLLSYNLVDVEYSSALDKLVIVSDAPPRVRLLDPETGVEQRAVLPVAPTAVSVEPGGQRAAVGHDGYVSIIDLDPLAVVDTWIVSAVVGDVVFGANNRVHSFPRVDQWVQVHTTAVGTGAETQSSGILYAGVQARLNPARTGVAYGADNGLSPSDIQHYDVSTTPVTGFYDSPYHGDYAMCGNLWITDDGATIITRCGNLFRSSDNSDLDMTYRGSLGDGVVYWADHGGASGELAVARRQGATDTLDFFEDTTFGPIRSRAIPEALVAGVFRRAVPRFVTYRSDESRIYVIADAGTFALFRMNP